MVRRKNGRSARYIVWLAAVLLFTVSNVRAQFVGRAMAYIKAETGPNVVMMGDSAVVGIGDTVTFMIEVNARDESIIGWRFHIEIDDQVFRPVLKFVGFDEDSNLVYVPFTEGSVMYSNATANAFYNRTGTGIDTLGNPDGNGIPGYQIVYGQTQAGATDGVTGPSLIVAYFDLEVVAFPTDGSGISRIRFISNSTRHSYFQKVGQPGIPYNFKSMNDLVVIISGALIEPDLPRAIIPPGDKLEIWMGQHLFSQFYDSTEVTWTASNIVNPSSIPFSLASQLPTDSTYKLTITTAPTDHDSISALIRLATPNPLFFDEQVFTAIIDHVPVFTDPLPAQPFTYDEDDSLTFATGIIFTDLDDTGPNISIWLEPDTLVHVLYDDLNNELVFYADTNGFTTAPLMTRLFVEDALGVSADTLLTFTVNPVNDAPIFNLDSLTGGLGDTLVIHHNQNPTVIDLKDFVTDEEGDDLSAWAIVSNSDPTNLPTAMVTSAGILTVDAYDSSPLPVDVTLVLQVSDDGTPVAETATDTLIVSIRPWPPEITFVGDIKIDATQDPADTTLDLAAWVDDLDTPASAMTWAFVALDAVTEAVDPSVTITPNNTTMTAVTLSVPTGYSAIDLLEMVVTDDYGYSDTDTARLFIFKDLAPMIFPLPGLTIYRDTTYAGILDLDDYVADLQDNPATIAWAYLDRDSLESFYIDPYSHKVTITTNSTFIGNLTVSLVATNSRGLQDTSDLAILVSRLVDGPPLWYAVPDVVEVVYGWTTDLFTYGQVCYDETPTDSIDFISYCDTTLLTVTVGPLDSVKLTTPILVKDSTTYIYFSAEDDSGRVSYSGTITVLLKDSFSPDWEQIPIIKLNIGETSSGLFLRDYVSDRDTDDNLLTIEVVNDNPYIDVSYDPVTTELTVSARVRTGDSWLSITATDDKGNTAITTAHVVVFAVADDTSPDGGLTYFFNPGTDRWIHYVAVADSTTDISRFTWDYSFGTPPRDWSDQLSFARKDSLPGTVTWIAPYHFQNEGSYTLIVTLTDAANNMLTPTEVLSVGFSKAVGGVLASPDQQLTVSYPPALIPNGKLLIISEDSRPDSAGQPTAEIAKARANEETPGLLPATVYSLDTNLPEPILVTLTYHQKRDADPYYSFYELDGEQLVKIETYTSTDGHFEAAATLDRDIVFAPSDTPARNAPLPGAELLCYPNPFNATIQVRFLLRWPDQGRIVIYDLLGREVYAAPRQLLEPGVHAFSWHSIDSRGIPAPSGVYFIRLETDGGKIVTRKVTLLK